MFTNQVINYLMQQQIYQQSRNKPLQAVRKLEMRWRKSLEALKNKQMI